MGRLFVAVWPPIEVRAALTALDRPAIAGVRWSMPEQRLVVDGYLVVAGGGPVFAAPAPV